MDLPVAFQRLWKERRRTAPQPVERYRIECAAQPINPWLELRGPGDGIRVLREGSHDFSSFAELGKTIVRPGMSDLEKALAVYRFSMRCACHGSMGWGNTEMTRFLNGHGYSFCWGQADFQHLLYEAVGLRARAPGLVGHSSVEVLIDGRWCALDAFMQFLAPAPELDGLATGEDLNRHPEILAHIREDDERVRAFQDYWSDHRPCGTYEPWQDSRGMMLSLRRGERVRIHSRGLGAWCLAPGEPPDYVNAEWVWKPKLDEEHLVKEAERVENVQAGKGGLAARDPHCAAAVEYLVHSPWPLCVGEVRLAFRGGGGLRVGVSTDGRRSWTPLHEGEAGDVSLSLDELLTIRGLPERGGASGASPEDARHDVLLRIEWDGGAVLRRAEMRFLVQINAPTVPRPEPGVNQWTAIGLAAAGSVRHGWEEYPDVRVSDVAPFEGDQVDITAMVHNRTSRARTRVPVRFTQSGRLLGKVIVPRIAARGSAEATFRWRAQIITDRPDGSANGSGRRYVNSMICAEVGPGNDDGEWTGVARAALTVRPRPAPRFCDGLIWASDGRFAHEERLVLRAALVNQLGRDVDPRLNYLPDSPLSATLTPCLGHPDEGGLRLAQPQRLESVQPTEFQVAQWVIPTGSLARRFTVWVEVVCDEPVAPEGKRLLASRRVSLR